MTNKLKIGVAGCGHLGKLHVKNLKELQSETNIFQLYSVFDIIKEKAEKISYEYNICYETNIDHFLSNIDALFIVTPTTTHFDVAKKALEKGKNIFIEKPICTNLSEAKILNDIKGKSIIQVGHIERFNPALLAAENFIKEPLFIETHRLSQFNPRGTDVSVIQDLMIHDIDIILSIVGSRLNNIYANGVPIITNKLDIANVRLLFENGCVANITSSRISRKTMRKMRIFQKSRYISIDFLKNEAEVFSLINQEDFAKYEKSNLIPIKTENNIRFALIEKPEFIHNNAMKYEQRLFINSILNNSKPAVSIEDGIYALETAEKIIYEIGLSNPESLI